MRRWIILFVGLGMLVSQLNAQTGWTKYAGNPVMDLTPGQFDQHFLWSPMVIYEDGVYKMWYSGHDGGINSRIGYATSLDGITWTKHGVVLDLGSWDSQSLHYPTVLRDGDTYKMWYSGHNGSSWHMDIGYATSPDGQNWEKHADNPVFPGSQIGSDFSLHLGTVLKDGSTYKMWFSAYSPSVSEHIRYATSPDGISWSDQGPVMERGASDEWDKDSIIEPFVILQDGIFHMWYSGGNSTENLNGIGYATSEDGITWTKNPYNPVLRNGNAGEWDNPVAQYCSVLREGTTYKMWYDGYDGTNSRIGYATSVMPAPKIQVVWTRPAVADTDTTYFSGTYYKVEYTASSSDPTQKVELWASQSPSLSTISSTSRSKAMPLRVYNPTSGLRNPTGATYGPGTDKAEATDVPISRPSQYVYTSDLSAGTWYLYLVRANGDGASTGGDTLGRSGALQVRHYPEILAFGMTEAEDDTVDEGTSFARDSGGNTPDLDIDLLLYAEDHDSNDPVRLYISTNANLTASTVSSDTSTYQIAGTTGWKTDDVGDTPRYAQVTISDSLGSSSFHPKGTYYFYALVQDAVDTSRVAFAKVHKGDQSQNLTVSHSPTLRFSAPADSVKDYSVADTPWLTLAWNGSGEQAGDNDIDDNASIALYFALTSVFDLDNRPTTLAHAAQMTEIVLGLREDLDGGANDQYAWDLSRFDGKLPAAGQTIRVWALLQDGGTTPVFVASPPISFASYQPSLVLLNPPPGTATEIRENDTYRFFFDADFVREEATRATVRYFISTRDTSSFVAADFDTARGVFPTDYKAFWISQASQLSEGVHSYFDWTPKDDGNKYVTEIAPPLTAANTTFYVYAVIRDSAAGITSPDSLKLARAPGRIKINGLGTTLSAPAVIASPTQTQVAPGDTIRVWLRGNTNHTEVQGVQLYVNLDSTKFDLVDQDGSMAGVQPFGFASGYFFGAVPAQVNRVNRVSGIYKLDLVKWALQEPAIPTDKSIAHLDLVARTFSGTAEVNWNLDQVNDPDRIPLFFNAGGALGGSFANPLATFKVVSRGTISGALPLQGVNRSSDSKVVTFWLRRPGSWLSVSDSVFVVANDDSSGIEGLQLTTGEDGSFTLTQVPAGVYELVAKAESYLAGYAPVSVVNGQGVIEVVPTWISATNNPGELLGGDITGDNQIEDKDASAFNLAYETSEGDANFNSAADIDDDGRVRLSDLLILAANIPEVGEQLTGVDPVYNFKPTVTAGMTLALSGVPLAVRAGEKFEVELTLKGVMGLAGYSLGLEFDPGRLEVVSAETPLLSPYPTLQIRRESRPGRYVLAEAVKGGTVVPVHESLLARVRLRALMDAVDPDLVVAGAYLADGSGRQVELSTRVRQVVPERFALWPNAPNPFNPSTQIRFDVPGDGILVALTVYNIMGQPVRRLVQSQGMHAGRYILSWDGRDDQGRPVGSGVYLYRLQAGDFVQSRKMTMMK